MHAKYPHSIACDREVLRQQGEHATAASHPNYLDHLRRASTPTIGWSHAVTSEARVLASCPGMAIPSVSHSSAAAPSHTPIAMGYEPQLPMRQHKTYFSFLQQEAPALAGMVCIQSVSSAQSSVQYAVDRPPRPLRRPCSLETRSVAHADFFSSGRNGRENQFHMEMWDDVQSQYPVDHRWTHSSEMEIDQHLTRDRASRSYGRPPQPRVTDTPTRVTDAPKRPESQPDRAPSTSWPTGANRWASPGQGKGQSARAGRSVKVVGVREIPTTSSVQEVDGKSNKTSKVSLREVQPSSSPRTQPTSARSPRPGTNGVNEARETVRKKSVSVVGVREVPTR